VVLESTTYPGTTEEDLREVLEAGSKLKAGKDFHLAYSPEREDPGNAQSRMEIIPKVVGGYTPACLERARALYGRAIKTIVAGLFLSRRRGHQAARKHFSQRKHRPGQRIETGVRSDGD